jgi:hypothetical protein
MPFIFNCIFLLSHFEGDLTFWSTIAEVDLLCSCCRQGLLKPGFITIALFPFLF